MKEHQISNLEAMDEREATRFLAALATNLSPEAEYEIRHEDYVMEMPQSGERFRGRDKMREFQEGFPDNADPPRIRIRRVLVRDGLWIVESIVDYGDQVSHGAAILELRDGKIWRDTRYFAAPFEAPEWRARWVERIEPAASAAGAGGPEAEAEDETDEDEVRRLIVEQWAKIQARDFAGAHEWYDDAVVVEWPQSGERVRGKDNLLALRSAYPAGVAFEMRRMIPRRDLGVSEYVIRYDGRPVYVVALVEFGGGKVVRETHYFADPFPPPEWRSQWVEPMGAS